MKKDILEILNIIDDTYNIIGKSRESSELYQTIRKNTERLDEIIFSTPEYISFKHKVEQYEIIDDNDSIYKETLIFEEFLMHLRESNTEVVAILKEQEYINDLVYSNSYFEPLEDIYLNLEEFITIFEKMNDVSEIPYTPEIFFTLMTLVHTSKAILDEFPDYETFENTYQHVQGYVINVSVYDALKNLNKELNLFL